MSSCILIRVEVNVHHILRIGEHGDNYFLEDSQLPDFIAIYLSRLILRGCQVDGNGSLVVAVRHNLGYTD